MGQGWFEELTSYSWAYSVEYSRLVLPVLLVHQFTRRHPSAHGEQRGPVGDFPSPATIRTSTERRKILHSLLAHFLLGFDQSGRERHSLQDPLQGTLTISDAPRPPP